MLKLLALSGVCALRRVFLVIELPTDWNLFFTIRPPLTRRRRTRHTKVLFMSVGDVNRTVLSAHTLLTAANIRPRRPPPAPFFRQEKDFNDFN